MSLVENLSALCTLSSRWKSLDRNERSARKSIGGGLCLFVDNSWATHYRILEQVCTPDYDILTVSFRPFYLPREFSQITVILAYVPGPNDEAAGGRIVESYNNLLARSSDQPVFILGDINSCNLFDDLPTLQQCVDIFRPSQTGLGRPKYLNG